MGYCDCANHFLPYYSFFFNTYCKKEKIHLPTHWKQENNYAGDYWKQYIGILCPILVCEFLWSLGENLYAIIYGNMGTDPCAAMTMTIPVQTLMIGALSGLSQAAAILVGKSLGGKQYEKAYADSKKLMKYGFAGSLCLSVILVAVASFYGKI